MRYHISIMESVYQYKYHNVVHSLLAKYIKRHYGIDTTIMYHVQYSLASLTVHIPLVQEAVFVWVHLIITQSISRYCILTVWDHVTTWTAKQTPNSLVGRRGSHELHEHIFSNNSFGILRMYLKHILMLPGKKPVPRGWNFTFFGVKSTFIGKKRLYHIYTHKIQCIVSM